MAPAAGVVIGKNGTLYGTTSEGGNTACGDVFGCGTVFSLKPPALSGGTWTETVLHGFDTTTGDGGSPLGGVTIGPGGVLYGTTEVGGTTDGTGSVYALVPPAAPGAGWVENVLFSFRGRNGAYPWAGLVVGKGSGSLPTLYGTTANGGTSTNCGQNGCGTAFALTPPQSGAMTGTWSETLLHRFSSTGDGSTPFAGLVAGSHGVLYGVTFYGGTSGAGTVFALVPPAAPGGAWTEAVVHSFSGTDGANPQGVLAVGPDGVLFGTTAYGGPANGGTVFSLAPPSSPGGPWTETVLFGFGVSCQGINPLSGVVVGTNAGGQSVLYGTTANGGASGMGTVFSLAPPTYDGGMWAETVLHSFGGVDGNYPIGSLAVGGDGTLYGTTKMGGTAGAGTVFTVTP
ncbi:MAG TPA: choice-of-anchor tandem repeat GloVer-containing protein [Bryobacteraceae bacterium]|nr:choice-of-anchor tandem repeat GloVer-containing protein [Bryobacteraceae bacterium]